MNEDFEKELLTYKYDILIRQGIQKCIDLINDKNKQINDLKLCNSDYYKQINTLSSKIFRIKQRLDYIDTNAESLLNDILDIINDVEIIEEDKKIEEIKN